MPTYQTNGTLTGTIDQENVGMAQDFLRSDPMGGYVADHAALVGVVEWAEWSLHADGESYHVTVVTNRELTDEELVRLSSAVSGQNSDGLGESFEQQDFAEIRTANYSEFGDDEDDYAGMISFDWKDNPSHFERVA